MIAWSTFIFVVHVIFVSPIYKINDGSVILKASSVLRLFACMDECITILFCYEHRYHNYDTAIMDHPFKWPWGFWGEFFFFLSANLMGNKFSVSDMDRKKSSESTLCLLKYCFCRKNNNVATTCCEKQFPMRHEAGKKIFRPRKKA